MIKNELKKKRKPRGSGDCRSGLGREFFPRGAAVWIPVALFVLLVLFQMVPLPAGILKVISPATYGLYEEIVDTGQECWNAGIRTNAGMIPFERDGWMNRMIPAGLDGKEKKGNAGIKDTEVKEKDEHRTAYSAEAAAKAGSNVQHRTSNEKIKNKTEGQEQKIKDDPHPGGMAFGFHRAGITPVPSARATPVPSSGATGRAGQAQINADDGIETKNEWRSISINKHGTLRMLLKFLAYMGIFFIVVYFNPSGQKRAVPDFIFGLIWVIFFLGIFNALFSFLQGMPGMQIQWLRPLAPPGIYLGTFKSPNNFSEFLEMVIPLAMGLLIVRNYTDVKRFSQHLGAKTARMAALFSKTGLLSFGIILLIPALFLSLCRGGFVTFPVTMVITLIFMVVSYRLHDRYSFVLFGLVIAGGFAYLIWLGVDPVINELQQLFASGPTSARPQTYIEAIAIIKDFPIFGVGFGDWHDIIMKYHTMVGRETWMPAIAYNDTLQITAETGFAGLACVAAFLFLIYKKAIQALKRGGDVVSQALILGGITAMSAALIHCQFDYLFYLPSNAVVFMVIAGITYRISNFELEGKDVSRKGAKALR